MTLHLTHPIRRLIIMLLAVLAMIAAALPTVFLLPASADHSDGSETLLGGFEIDGDFEPGSLTPPGKDWTDIGTVTAADDLDAPSDDLIDGKENDPSSWGFHTGTATPTKADILRTFFATDTHDDKPYVFLGYEILDASGQGATSINFELNQGTTNASKDIVTRQEGDLLVTYDYPGGEKPVEIEAFQWDGSEWIATPSEVVVGDVNGKDRAWPDVEPFNTTSESVTVKAQHFGEVGVDLKSVVGDDCITVGSAWSKTRTSGENPLTSELTDYIKPINVPPINTCGSIEVEKEDEDGNLLDGATFELWMDDEADESNKGSFDAGDTLIDTCVTGETGQDPGTCLWDDLEPGTYWVIEVSPPALYTMDGAESIPPHPDDEDETARTGVVHPVTLASLQDHTVPAGTFVNPKIPFKLTVEPKGTNLVGDAHEFVVTLWTDGNDDDSDGTDGDGFETAVGGEDLDLDWSGTTNSTITQVVDGGGTAPDLDTASTSCTTREQDSGSDDADTSMDEATDDETGTCVVTVNSTDSGQGTLTATYRPAYQHYTADDDVTGSNDKTWIDYRLSVSPETDENLVDSEHVFTVLVEKDSGDGEGFQPLADANPSFEISGGPGEVVADGDLCASVGTDASGECTVTISSSETGTTTVQASYLGDAADSEAATFGSNPATKMWVDYLIDVDPDRAVNPVGTTHTFTVTLQRIEDGVATAAAGESVTLSIAGPGEVIEVPAGTIDGDARGGSCTTDDVGQCDVTIASDDVGDTTLSAEYAAQVGDSTGTFSDSGLKLWRSDPAIEIVKEADIEPTADGLKIINCNEVGCPETEFTFTVTNVGGVHLHDVTVTDDEFGPITLQDDELEVGESTTGTATYTPTRAEIDAGFHENLGTATGVSPDDQTVQDTDPERVEIIEVLPAVIERPEPAPEPDPVPLPRTGTDVAWLTAQALLALLLGWSMLWLGRRREIADQA